MDYLNELLNTHKLPLILSFIGLVLIVGGIFSSQLHKSTSKSYPKESLISSPGPATSLKIDISGAVKNPGVYTVEPSIRVEDAIKIAGGFDDHANSVYISKSLNLSQKLSDGQKLYVPFEGESSGGVVSGVSSGGTTIVGLNSGSEKDLEGLPGIGPASAQKIIDSRPYRSVDDLLSKKVVSKSVFEKVKDLVNTN